MPGLIIAAPYSGAGKTTITLGLLRALKIAGHPVRSAKSGPDYIDPQFHAAASGQPCVNLDAWAMTPERIKSLAASQTDLIIEGAMGLFDGAPPDGKGSSADLARILGLPVVLVVDAKAMSQSIAALVAGFASHDPNVRITGIILNRVGSDRHTAMLNHALAPLGIPVLGAIPRDDSLARPSRHLGLVQAGEMPDLEVFLNTAAKFMSRHIDLDALRALMMPTNGAAALATSKHPERQTGHRIAIAQDAAFSFSYAQDIELMKRAGATIISFSPLANEPVPDADVIILPGGYPELYAAQLAANQTFMQSLRFAAQTTEISGECGGYMVLGERLIDATGTAHKMAGLIGLTTSFQTRKLHLGYRKLRQISPTRSNPNVTQPVQFAAHEFHYATTLDAQGTPLFDAQTADGTALGQTGLVEGNVSGSFMHIIDVGAFAPIALTAPQA